MKISVIILNWKRPQDTIKAVKSVLRQDHPDFNVLIWDNASGDDSEQVLSTAFHAEPRVKIVFSPENYGVAGGRDRAFRIVDGDILVSLDSDAIFEGENSLSLIARELQAVPDLGMVSFEVRRPDGHTWWPFARPQAQWKHRSFDTFRADGCAFAVRRSVFQGIGFPEHFSPYGAEDAYFALCTIRSGYRVLYLPSVRVIHDSSKRGRLGTAFTKHVRNSLWIRMELFPFLTAVASLPPMMVHLLQDARQQRQVKEYLRGVGEAFRGFRVSRRKPIPRKRWHYVRQLMREDKRLPLEQDSSHCEPAPETGSLRCVAGHAWFYARVLMLFPAKAMVRLLALVQPAKKPEIELRALRLCNRLFRAPMDPMPFVSRESLYGTQDVSDYFGLSSRVRADRAWFQDKRLLEIGCGLGKYSSAAMAQGAREVCGIDVDEKGIEFAKAMAQKQGVVNVSFHVMSVEDLRFEDNSFDGVFSRVLFEHRPDVRRTLAETYRVLKPGGELIFTFDAFRSRHGAHAIHFVGVPWPFFFFDPETVATFWAQELDACLRNMRTTTERTTQQQISEIIDGLSRLKVSDIETMILRSPFRIVAVVSNGEEAPLLTLFPFLRKMPAVYECLRGNAVFRLLKPLPENAVTTIVPAGT